MQRPDRVGAGGDHRERGVRREEETGGTIEVVERRVGESTVQSSGMGIVGTHPGRFRKSGKHRTYGIRNLEECVTA